MSEARPMFMLYSLEHGRFWSRPGIGYTVFLHQAVRYSQEQAQEVSRGSVQFWKPEHGYASAPDIVVPEALTRISGWVEDKAGVLQQLVMAQLPAWPFPVVENMRLLQEQLLICCPVCQMVSYNRNDVEEGYCGACHRWTSVPAAGGLGGTDNG